MAPRKTAAAPPAPAKRKPRVKTPPPAPKPPQTVLEALTRELAKMPQIVRESSMALTAREIANQISFVESSRDLAVLSKELREVCADLATAVAEAGDKGDAVDELRARREARRATAG